MQSRILALLFFLILSGCATLPKHYTSLADGKNLKLPELLQEIESSRAVFVGELHATPGHHRVQLEVIKHLHFAGNKVAIAFELLPQSRQYLLDQWVYGKISEAKFRVIYQEHVNLPFTYYQDIFRFAREKAIPIVAINADIALIASVAKDGPGSIPEEIQRKFRFSSCTENKEYASLFGMPKNRQYHTAGMPYLCDAQRLRDSIMAYNVAQLVHSDDNDTVIVLTGIVHAVKIAMPEMLENFDAIPYKVLLPDKVNKVIPRKITPDITDYLWYD